MNNSSTIPGVPREEVAKFDDSTVILDFDRTRKSSDNEKKRVTLYDELTDKGDDMKEADRNRFVQYY